MLTTDTVAVANPIPEPQKRFRDGPLLPEMVVVPPGKFWMGADDAEGKLAMPVEKPRHWVEIRYSLAVGRCPVTFEQWDAFANDEPSMHRPDDRGLGRGRLAVFNVSWEDAQSYVSWLSANTGRYYRLLSEAEWEYCCRAGSNANSSTANGTPINGSNFPHLDFGDQPGAGRPVPVGSYPANAFGLCDMHGAASELVADAWHDTYQGAPADGSAWGEAPAMWRVVRGGGGDGLPRTVRLSARDWVHHIQRMDHMGFRVACGLE